MRPSCRNAWGPFASRELTAGQTGAVKNSMQADNLRIPALILMVLAWIILALTLTSALSMGVWLIAYSQLAESPIMLAIYGIAMLVTQLLYIPSVIAVLVWVYMANNNLHHAGLTGLNYSPAWATFSFLIPVVNLIVPARALRELANRSAGEPEELADAEVDVVMSWSGCWIGSFVVGLFLGYTAIVTLLPGIWITTPFWATQGLIVLANILTAASAYFLIQVVKLVTSSQRDFTNMASTFD